MLSRLFFYPFLSFCSSHRQPNLSQISEVNENKIGSDNILSYTANNIDAQTEKADEFVQDIGQSLPLDGQTSKYCILYSIQFNYILIILFQLYFSS